MPGFSFCHIVIAGYEKSRYTLIGLCLIISGSLFFIPDISTNRFHISTALWIEGMSGVMALLFALDFCRKKIVVPSLHFLLLMAVYAVYEIANGESWSSLLVTLVYFLSLFNILRAYNSTGIIVAALFLALALLSACLGGMQYIGSIPSFHSIFPITGTFNNPAGLACLLAVSFPISLAFFSSARTRLMKTYSLLIGMGMFIITLLSASRTAFLSILVTLALYYGYGRFLRKRVIVGCAFALALIILLYLINPVSANGRILIWTCCLRLITTHFWTGVGIGNFQKEYMMGQAEFFKSHPASALAFPADNIHYPFNEFIGLLVEQGIVGFILTMYIIGYAYRQMRIYSDATKKTVSLCLLSLAICSLFSYPFFYPIFRLLLLSLVALMMSRAPAIELKMQSWKLLTCMLLLLGFLCFDALSKGYNEYIWKSARTRLEEQNISAKDVESFSILYKNNYLKRNGNFLYNYAVILYEAGLYSKSLQIIESCKDRINDYDVQLLSGYNNLNLKNYVQAENDFQTASFMIPSRLLPRYKLMNLYISTNREVMAIEMAKNIIKLPLKTNSQEARYMKRQVEEYMYNVKKERRN